MKTNSPRPRSAGYRSVGNAITLVAATRRLLLVQLGSLITAPLTTASGQMQ
jgi:hypothetical protein